MLVIIMREKKATNSNTHISFFKFLKIYLFEIKNIYLLNIINNY